MYVLESVTVFENVLSKMHKHTLITWNVQLIYKQKFIFSSKPNYYYKLIGSKFLNSWNCNDGLFFLNQNQV